MSEVGKAIASGAAESPAGRLLGMQLFETEPGHRRVEFQAREEFYNPAGVVQGGFLAAMLDFTMGAAARSVIDKTETRRTLEMKVSYIQSTKAGKLIGEGRVVHKGRSVFFAEGSLMAEDGTLLATGTSTWRILPRPNGARSKEG